MSVRLHSLALGVALCLITGCGDSATDAGGAGGAGGSTSTLGGSGGAGGGEDCGCGELEQCFGELCVAKLVELPNGTAIDATEVTRDQFAAWLATNPDPADSSDSSCVTNITYTPERDWPERNCKATDWPPGERGDHPVVCIDWCDAFDYCVSVGKRLCGAIDGGANAYEDYADASKSAWFAACSADGDNTFPYGDEYDGSACNGLDTGLEETAPVGSLATCQSADPAWAGVFDLSGNVREWEDSCVDEVGDVPCHMRGGSYFDDEIGNLAVRGRLLPVQGHLALG